MPNRTLKGLDTSGTGNGDGGGGSTWRSPGSSETQLLLPRMFACQLFVVAMNLYLRNKRTPAIYSSSSTPCRRQLLNAFVGAVLAVLCFGFPLGAALWLPALLAPAIVLFANGERRGVGWATGGVKHAARVVIVCAVLCQLALNYVLLRRLFSSMSTSSTLFPSSASPSPWWRRRLFPPSSKSSASVVVDVSIGNALRHAVMLAWLRLAGLCLNMRDGRSGTSTIDLHGELSFCEVPTLLEIVSYCLDPQMILGGPVIPYKHVRQCLVSEHRDSRTPAAWSPFDSANYDDPDHDDAGDDDGDDDNHNSAGGSLLGSSGRQPTTTTATTGWAYARGSVRLYRAVARPTSDRLQWRQAVSLVASCVGHGLLCLLVQPFSAAPDDIRRCRLFAKQGLVGQLIAVYIVTALYMVVRYAHWRLGETVCASAGYTHRFERRHNAAVAVDDRAERYYAAGHASAVDVAVTRLAGAVWFDELLAGWDMSRRRMERLLVLGYAVPGQAFRARYAARVFIPGAAFPPGEIADWRSAPDVLAHVLWSAALSWMLAGGRFGVLLSTFSCDLFAALARYARKRCPPYPIVTCVVFAVTWLLWPAALLPLSDPTLCVATWSSSLLYIVPHVVAVLAIFCLVKPGPPYQPLRRPLAMALRTCGLLRAYFPEEVCLRRVVDDVPTALGGQFFDKYNIVRFERAWRPKRPIRAEKPEAEENKKPKVFQRFRVKET